MTQPTPFEPLSSPQVDHSNQRLLWTGAAANGALILALIGFAAGGDDQAASLRTITLPVVVAIAGFSFGAAAIMFDGARLAQRLVEGVAQRKFALAHNQQAAFKEVLSSPSMDASVARLVWGDRADDEVKKLILERLAAAQVQTDKSQQTFDEAMAMLEASNKTGHGFLKTAHRWLQASFIAAALAVLALMAQAWIERFERAPEKYPPAAVVEAPQVLAADASPAPELPPCRDGSAECDPWARDWKEPPPVGTVVSGPK